MNPQLLGKLGPILQVIGAFIVARKMVAGILGLYRAFLRKRKNLLERYGRNTWAIVTGASDGIGQEFCRQLSKIGFNIVLIARTEKKLRETAAELVSINPKIHTRVVVADLSRANEDGFVETIFDQISDLDVSILINNAGIDVFDYFEKIDHNYLKKMISINCTALYLLNSKMIKKMIDRPHKSAIINVSSGAVNTPVAYYSTYNGTKALVDWFTMSVADEFPNIDFMSMKPYDVSTNMINNRQEDIMTISREECVRGFLDCLGHETRSVGHWKHRLQDWLYAQLPRWLINFVLFKFLLADFFAERKNMIPTYRGLPVETTQSTQIVGKNVSSEQKKNSDKKLE